MAIDHCLFSDGLRKFLAILEENKKDLFLYILIIIGLGLATGIIVTIIALICLILVLIAAAILFGLPYLLIAALLKAKLVFIIFAVIVGIPFLAAVLLLFLLINLPFSVFFRSFSLYFLSSLNCGYTPLPLAETEEPAQK
jgi:hypothetical protein